MESPAQPSGDAASTGRLTAAPNVAPAVPMTPGERRATTGLAGIYGLRMLGMFIVLPVLALYAETLPGGQDHTLVGIALGAYGLTQAVLQIPFGWASDRWGRKPPIIFSIAWFTAFAPLRDPQVAVCVLLAGRSGNCSPRGPRVR
jgi:MFS family permease